ncbi:MAG: rod shape-determining protein RodA [Alphaproteobacteria bacterium]
MPRSLGLRRKEMSLLEKATQIHWFFVVLICLTAGIGFLMLYSAANGSLDPWASRQMIRFGVGLVVMFAVAFVDIRFWMRAAYIIYLLAFAFLVGVEITGLSGMGAQRWVDLGVVQLQPSEMMKLALVIGLARYFHGATLEQIGKPIFLVIPLAMIVAPAGLVLKQPDLGTAGLLILGGAAMCFLAGIKLWKFGVAFVLALGAVPLAWGHLHGYQKTRILSFLNPELDPLGAGYHTLQSKIALGSGGLFGKGYLQGTQSHLNFLPERQTDFIFTMLAEEFGMVGSVGLLTLYLALIAYGIAISVRSTSRFGQLLGMGISTTFFLYVFFNVAMVMGLIPVVGVPLPLISYGGSAMMTLLVGFGLLLNVYVHRDVPIGRRVTSPAV